MITYNSPPNCQVVGLDNIYRGLFRSQGYFVDVGALDGLNYSNTLALANAGWQGLWIEPVKRFYNFCQDRINKDSLNITALNFAVGNVLGKGIIYTGEHAVSTLNREFKKMLEKEVSYTGQEECDIVTLDWIFETIVPKNILVDVLSIDVEGYELEVLNPEINKYFSENHYIKIYSDEINNIYINPNCFLRGGGVEENANYLYRWEF